MRIILMFIANFFRLPYMAYMLYHTTAHKDRYSKQRRYDFLHWLTIKANHGGRVKVLCEGRENLPKDPGYIMFPNHQGMYDALTLIGSLTECFSLVAKMETSTVPMLHTVLECMDSEYMDRSDVRQSLTVINSMTKRVREGETFLIFPEGTRSKAGNSMNEFKAGSFKAAKLSHCPIVPIALIDCYIPFDRQSIKKVNVQAHILKPLYYDEYKDLSTHEIAELVQERIREKITEVTGVESQIIRKEKPETTKADA